MSDKETVMKLCDKKIITMRFKNSDAWFDFREKVEEIADYLLENGVIVPPVKVRDTVYYYYCDEFHCVLPYFVESFHIDYLDKERDYWYWEANSHAEETDELLDGIDFDLDNIGKTVFLTKEEAEEKLKELGNSES